jgi:hypothetical protein
MAKVRILTDDEYKKNLTTQWKEAKIKADKLHVEYDVAERAYQCISEGIQGGLDSGQVTQYLFTANSPENTMPLIEGLDLVKAVLFLHSKLCISDPVVQVTARKQDPATKRAAECTQAYLPYMRQRMHLQEVLESGVYLNTVVYGNGIAFNGWDPDGGEFPFDEFPTDEADLAEKLETGFKMEGDYDFRNVHPRKFFPDGSADSWINAEHCFEEWEIPFEKAMYKFDKPEQQEILREYHNTQQASNPADVNKSQTTIKLYNYYVRGRPWNGFLGSHSVLVDPENPKLLTRGPNPFDHKKLPYNVMSDIDVPGNVMGMSRIIYAYQTQMCINNMMMLIMKNMALFGGNKMMLPEGSINQDIINNALDDVGYFNPATGGKPEYLRPANVTSDVWRAYDIMKGYINNLYGMNEFSQGQVPRELSSFAVQLALEMDDKYRIRLFNKKKLFLRDTHYQGLENTKQFMTESRRLSVVGLESFTDDGYFTSTSLKGDCDVEVEYGPYMPVDPAARKQQILEFIKSGFFEKAGGNMKKAASLLIDGSMLDVKAGFEQSSKRQKAEIDSMINGEVVQIQPWNKHEEHLIALEDFTDSETFNALPLEVKKAIWQHSELHVEALAQQIAKSQGPATGTPPQGKQPSGAMPPTGVEGPAKPTTPAITQATGPTV